MNRFFTPPLLAGIALIVVAAPVWAQAPRGGSLLPGAVGGGPISINANELDYFDKDQKLVYSGGVIVKQGGAVLKASSITILMSSAAGGEAAAAPGNMGQISRMEAAGPVTVTSQDQVGVGDRGVFDKAENRVHLIGHVTLTQGPNVQTCDELVYNLSNNVASCTGRVSGMFTPGSQPSTGGDDKGGKPSAKPPKRRASQKTAH